MVNNKKLRRIPPGSAELDKQPDGKGGIRKYITNGPVYILELVQKHLTSYDVKVVTEKGSNSLFDLAMDEDDLRPFIKALGDSYKNSQICHTTPGKSGGQQFEIECDAHSINWNRHEKRRMVNAKQFYIKFGFSEHYDGCLVISFK